MVHFVAMVRMLARLPSRTDMEVCPAAPPAKMEKALEEAERVFVDMALDTKRWTLESEKEGVSVWTMWDAIDGRKVQRVRAEMVIEKCDSEEQRQTLMQEASLYDRRILWDKGIQQETVLRQYEDPMSTAVVCYTSHAAVGGLIQPRIFVDCRRFQRMPDGSLLSCSVDWPDDDNLVPVGEYIRGHNLPGGGILITPSDADGRSKVVVMGCVDLSGWLPPAIVSSGMISAFRDISMGVASQAQLKAGAQKVIPMRD